MPFADVIFARDTLSLFAYDALGRRTGAGHPDNPQNVTDRD